MKMNLIFFVLLCIFLQKSYSSDFPELNHIRTLSNAELQANATLLLIERFISTRASEFNVIIDKTIGPLNKDTFSYETVDGNKLQITATSGVAAAWGFYYFLKNNCNCHISWGGNQLKIPKPLPLIKKPITITSADRFRYYQNVCTVSYSFVWHNWLDWQREIDWMAINGINFPLAFNGQEAIWNRVYLAMGLTQTEIDQHYAGPAFLAWSRMGNIRGWGGPLSTAWHQGQFELQHKILDRIRSLGMIPILPAFSGHVPYALKRVFPHANVSKLNNWNAMNSTYCCVMLLEPTDPLFQQIGKRFLTEYISEFGTDHVYNTDTFNEMTPRSGDPAYLAAASRSVYEAMTIADAKAVWVMQGWIFVGGPQSFWTNERAKALLTAVPQGRMIILDLQSEILPQYELRDSYFGQPFIWCMLHNFGGTISIYGVIENVNNGPITARKMKSSSMIGTGLTPEGIYQNDMIYEFMMENSWRTSPRNITEWISFYALRRYGKTNKDIDMAWQLLKKSLYNCTDRKEHHNRYGIVVRPNFQIENKSLYNCTTNCQNFAGDVIPTRLPRLDPEMKPNIWYDPKDLYDAWGLFVNTSENFKKNYLFQYDLVDVTRESLQAIAYDIYKQLISAYKASDKMKTRSFGKQLINILMELESLLASDNHFSLGIWLQSAKNLATNDADKLLFEYNARNQLTLWGPKGEILDYANKQWSGLIEDYYRPRWELFINQLILSLNNGKMFNQTQFNIDVFQMVEEPFTFSKKTYSTQPQGDAFIIAKQLYAKYSRQRRLVFKPNYRLYRNNNDHKLKFNDKITYGKDLIFVSHIPATLK